MNLGPHGPSAEWHTMASPLMFQVLGCTRPSNHISEDHMAYFGCPMSQRSAALRDAMWRLSGDLSSDQGPNAAGSSARIHPCSMMVLYLQQCIAMSTPRDPHDLATSSNVKFYTVYTQYFDLFWKRGGSMCRTSHPLGVTDGDTPTFQRKGTDLLSMETSRESRAFFCKYVLFERFRLSHAFSALKDIERMM